MIASDFFQIAIGVLLIAGSIAAFTFMLSYFNRK